MIPKLVLMEEIERLYNKLDELDRATEKEPDTKKQGELAMKWYKTHKMVLEFENYIEFKIKLHLDSLQP